MKRVVVVNASRQPVSNRKHLDNARNYLKSALDELEEIPNDGQHGEFSSYLYEELRTLVMETSSELEI